MPNLIKNMTWNQFMQLTGITALSVLMGIGTVDVQMGLPFLTGVIGLSINTKETTPIP